VTGANIGNNMEDENDEQLQGNNVPNRRFIKKIRPKTHYLLHYPRMIQMLGPPTHLWCMTMEQMNASGKAYSYHTRNYKNLWLSIAQHYQKRTLRDLISSTEQITSTKPHPMDASTLPVALNETTPVFYVKRLTVFGIDYREGQTIVVNKEQEQPIFRKIVKILKDENDWIFLVQLVNIIRYNLYSCSFVCQLCDNYTFMPTTALISPYPLDGYKIRVGDDFHVVLKHRI
jgi:hypothetical protein